MRVLLFMNCDDFSKVEPLTVVFGHPHRHDVMGSYTLHSYKALSNQEMKLIKYIKRCLQGLKAFDYLLNAYISCL